MFCSFSSVMFYYVFVVLVSLCFSYVFYYAFSLVLYFLFSLCFIVLWVVLCYKKQNKIENDNTTNK